MNENESVNQQPPKVVDAGDYVLFILLPPQWRPVHRLAIWGGLTAAFLGGVLLMWAVESFAHNREVTQIREAYETSQGVGLWTANDATHDVGAYLYFARGLQNEQQRQQLLQSLNCVYSRMCAVKGPTSIISPAELNFDGIGRELYLDSPASQPFGRIKLNIVAAMMDIEGTLSGSKELYGAVRLREMLREALLETIADWREDLKIGDITNANLDYEALKKTFDNIREEPNWLPELGLAVKEKLLLFKVPPYAARLPLETQAEAAYFERFGERGSADSPLAVIRFDYGNGSVAHGFVSANSDHVLNCRYYTPARQMRSIDLPDAKWRYKTSPRPAVMGQLRSLQKDSGAAKVSIAAFLWK